MSKQIEWIERHFIPRTNNVFISAFIFAAYAQFIASILNQIDILIVPNAGLEGRPDNFGEVASRILFGLFLSPIIESIILIGLMKIGSIFRMNCFFIVLASSLLMATTHIIQSPSKCVIVFPMFFLSAIAYTIWKEKSHGLAIVNMILIHVLYNISPVLGSI